MRWMHASLAGCLGIACGLAAVSAPRPSPAAVLEGRIVLEAGTPQHRSKSVLNPFTAILGEARTPQHAVIDPRDGVVWTVPQRSRATSEGPRAAVKSPAVRVVAASRGEGQAETAALSGGSDAARLMMVRSPGGFEPHVSAVVIGSSATVKNTDHVAHALRAEQGGKVFDLGTWSSGESRPVRFGKSGPVHLACTCHDGPGAWIYVTPTRDCARPDAQGRFHIAGVASGRHQVHVWHPQRGVRVHEVEVGPAGTHVEIRY